MAKTRGKTDDAACSLSDFRLTSCESTKMPFQFLPLFFACFIAGPAPTPTHADLTPKLTDILKHQQAAWNSADIAGFMQAYWKDEGLTFSSGGKVTRGWQSTFDGYKKRYPDKATMGQLTFSDLEVTSLGNSAAMMLGRWKLKRAEPVGGNFTLVWKKIDDTWVIVHDHTSSDAQ